MEKWNEFMKEIYRNVECEPERIISCALTGGEEITKNAMLYLPDIMWELYFEKLIGSDEEDKYEIDYVSEEWKEYNSLLYVCDKDKEPGRNFGEKAGRFKASRSKVTLLDFIHIDKIKTNENSIIFPDDVFIPIYILYLQNKEFFSLFTNGEKNKKKFGENIVRFGNKLMEYDKYYILRYTYEKLTGVNLALLFANYFVDMTKCIGSLRVLDIPQFKIEEDTEWKRNGKVYKELLKNSLLSLLGEIIIVPNIFGRIIWADIILQSLYAEEKKYISTYDINDLGRRMVVGYSGNAGVIMHILNKMEEIKNGVKLIEENRGISKGGYACFAISDQYYEAYKEFVFERMVDVPQREKEVAIYNQWSMVSNQIKQIISQADEDSIIGYEHIGDYIKEDAKDNSNKQMPIIFMRDDVMRSEEYTESVNEFLTYALVQSKNKN